MIDINIECIENIGVDTKMANTNDTTIRIKKNLKQRVRGWEEKQTNEPNLIYKGTHASRNLNFRLTNQLDHQTISHPISSFLRAFTRRPTTTTKKKITSIALSNGVEVTHGLG